MSATSCCAMSRGPAPRFSLGDLNPLSWLGDAASEAAGETWTSAMVAAWSSGVWMLDTAFRMVDAFTSPDLTASGPMGSVYPFTFGLGLVVAVAMAFAQIGVAAFKRDGASLARLLIGVAQFGVVWAGYVGIAAALVTAADGLTQGLLQSMLGVDDFAGYTPGSEWPRDVTDTVTATVLGICSWALLWPASIMYLLIMVVREAALVLLAATSPIAAGGLMSEFGRAWFWKSLRWFIAALMVAPLSALVLGVGQQLSQGVVSGAGDSSSAAAGMAVVGSVLVLIGALCPLVVFRLLSFVDPGTSSGAAMRASLSSNGGFRGLVRGGAQSSGAAAQSDGLGRSAGEASADAATTSRFASAGSGAMAAAGAVGAAVAVVGKVAHSTVSVASDVLSSSGVGHAHPYYPPYMPERGGARTSPPPPAAVVGQTSAGAGRDADPGDQDRAR